jgi:hypothetical protein
VTALKGAGATNRSNLESTMQKRKLPLTPEDLGAIDAAASKIAVQGARYPEHLEQRTGL